MKRRDILQLETKYNKIPKKHLFLLRRFLFHFNWFSMIQIFDMFKQSITGGKFFFAYKTLENDRSFRDLENVDVHRRFSRRIFKPLQWWSICPSSCFRLKVLVQVALLLSPLVLLLPHLLLLPHRMKHCLYYFVVVSSSSFSIYYRRTKTFHFILVMILQTSVDYSQVIEPFHRNHHSSH